MTVRRHRRVVGLVTFDGCNQPITLAWHGRDVCRDWIGITEQFPQLPYSLVNGRRRDNDATPDAVQQLLRTDDLSGCFSQPN